MVFYNPFQETHGEFVLAEMEGAGRRDAGRACSAPGVVEVLAVAAPTRATSSVEPGVIQGKNWKRSLWKKSLKEASLF